MKENFIFTKTMAKLYEQQEKYWEAYIIYKNLLSKEYSKEINDKLVELGNKIISESSYSQKTLTIFSKNELIKLSIFSEAQYKNYKKIQLEMLRSENFETLLESYQESSDLDSEIKKYSGEEIYEIIQSNFGGKKPDEIKLADIYEIIKNK